MYVKPLPNIKISETIQQEYEEDDKSLKQYLKDSDYGTDKDRLDSELKKNLAGIECEDNEVKTLYDDIKQLTYGNTSNKLIEGTESFVDGIKDYVARIIRMIKNFATYLYELFANKVKRLRNRYNKIKFKLQSEGIKVGKEIPYSLSIRRLSTTPKIISTPTFITNSLDIVSDFYKDVMSGYNAIRKVGVVSPDKDTFELSKDVGKAYGKSISPGSVNQTLMQSRILPGCKVLKTTISQSDSRFTDTDVIFTQVSTFPNDLLITFNADRSIVESILNKVKTLTDLIENEHKSVSSLSRDFEREVMKVYDTTKYPTDKAKRDALHYFNWLQQYQRKAVTLPLLYVIDTLNAALDYCRESIG